MTASRSDRQVPGYPRGWRDQGHRLASGRLWLSRAADMNERVEDIAYPVHRADRGLARQRAAAQARTAQPSQARQATHPAGPRSRSPPTQLLSNEVGALPAPPSGSYMPSSLP
jgi:hypothetical protein